MLYYGIYGGLAFLFGLFIFKYWDKKQSSEAVNIIQAPEWLIKTRNHTPNTNQTLYEFSVQYIAVLKGVFAAPTARKMQQLNSILANAQNSDDQLWRDMSLRLNETYNSYSIEYITLIETIAQHSQDVNQLYAASQLATRFPDAPAKLLGLAEKIAASPMMVASSTLRRH